VTERETGGRDRSREHINIPEPALCWASHLSCLYSLCLYLLLSTPVHRTSSELALHPSRPRRHPKTHVQPASSNPSEHSIKTLDPADSTVDSLLLQAFLRDSHKPSQWYLLLAPCFSSLLEPPPTWLRPPAPAPGGLLRSTPAPVLGASRVGACSGHPISALYFRLAC